MVPINARLLREESAWILQNSQACLLVTSAQFYPMYQQIQQEDATQLRHIPCLTDVALPADDGVSSFTQLKNQQPATLCYAPPLSTDDTAENSLHLRHHLPTERCGDLPITTCASLDITPPGSVHCVTMTST